MGNFKLDGRTIGIGILVVLAALIFLPRLLNNNADTNPTGTDVTYPQDNSRNTNDTSLPSGSSNADIEMGAPVAAAGVDSNGCPVNSTTNFENTEDVYIIAPGSYIPEGTSVFVRLYHEDTAVEDSQEIVADRDYQNTCINFVFEPAGAPFDTGSYMAEFYVNGNAADSVEFQIQ